MVIEQHIEQIIRRKGWKAAKVEQRLWLHTEWDTDPVLNTGVTMLVVQFECWLPGVTVPNGSWKFTSSGNKFLDYNKGTTELEIGTNDTWMRSTLVSEHEGIIKYASSGSMPTSYVWLKILLITEG